MPTLLVTNDFPPTVGGIQSYVRDFAAEYVRRAGVEELVVFASTQNSAAAQEWDQLADYRIIRWPHRVMLPTPDVSHEMQRIIREESIETVWFGAAAPLGLLGRAAKKAGARRVVASTHGHEVGWAMLPVARQGLRVIGSYADAITYISQYTHGRIAKDFGPDAPFVALPSGVDTQFFYPADNDKRLATRQRFGLGEAPIIVCASRLVRRKGQDTLIDALSTVRDSIPNARLVIVGSGPYETALRARADHHGDAVIFTGAVDRSELRDIVGAADVFAMPARTRLGGLDVEGLGIVYLEAQACGVPVVAGESGGAPETVTAETGHVVNGRHVSALAEALIALLSDPAKAREMGQRGRRHVEQNFSWETLGERFYKVLTATR